MKTKKLDKKLILNKQTVVRLNNDEMKKLEGGVSIAHDSCAHSGCPNCMESTIVFCQ